MKMFTHLSSYHIIKKKGEIAPVLKLHTIKTLRSGGIALPFLTSALYGVSGQLCTPAIVPTRKESQYLLDRRLGGPQSQSGLWRREKPLHPIGC
jgi:hypothetical protein